ncbi:MAG TPA: hypothetical protein VFT12_12170, partial [Thermoanaerobaculia bacterium]|nr:hypothetical protein [Thermoanaerobaculia bacterium]
MPQVHRFADFLTDLQQLDRTSIDLQAPKIIEAFARHTPFELGALYLRDRESSMRLAAKSQQCVAPDI